MAELPPFEMYKTYALILNTMYMVAFYSPILPLANLWALFNITGLYWMIKVKNIKKYNNLLKKA